MKMMNLLLIRHAHNDWVGKRLAGWTPGIHLNEQGRAEAEALARRLAKVPLAAVYSSPLERTVETATPLAEAHGLPVHLCEPLGETRAGEWTGRSLEELKKEDLWPVIQVYPGGARFPGGESMREVQARIVAQLDAIRDAHGDETVAVISHSDPIRMATAYYLGLPLDLFQRLVISPASVTAFSFGRYGPRLVVMNHVEPLPSFEMDREEGEEL
jgi:probable phosphomutase (TIGR03848 family)